MKKTFSILILSIMIFSFTSCEKEKIYNSEEFLKELNILGNYTLESKDFTITKNEFFIYSLIINEHILLTLYANENNNIIQCTITTDIEPNEAYHCLCENSCTVITGCDREDCKKIINEIKNAEKKEFNGWLLTNQKTEIGSTLIINRINNEINSNTLPTIKDFISKDDVSRPTTENNAIQQN